MSSAAVKFLCGLYKEVSVWVVLDAEGGHVTIQGPSPEPGFTTAVPPSSTGVGVDQAHTAASIEEERK